MEKQELFKEWLKLKKAENTAKEKRHVLETQIEELYSFEGQSKKFKEEGFDVTIKKSESYTLDQEAYKNIRLDIAEELRPEKIKFELDKSGYTWLKENNQEIYKKVSDCVTFKIGKSTINIEKVK
jgi:hypothetical protein